MHKKPYPGRAQGRDAEARRAAEERAPPAAEPSAPAAAAAAPPAPTLGQAVALRARRFLGEQFGADGGGAAETEGVLRLRCVPGPADGRAAGASLQGLQS